MGEQEGAPMHQRCREGPLHDLLHAIARFVGPILICQPIHLAVGYLDDLTGHERSQIINGFIRIQPWDAISPAH
jgi:hypothetical protein